MGYHVSIVRTGAQEKIINQEELISVVEGQFQFTLDRDSSGSIKQAFREVSGEEVVLFYDGNELWTRNPSETALKTMYRLLMLSETRRECAAMKAKHTRV